MGVIALYRPVCLDALRLIEQAGMRAFPPRLPGQPIFYPVTNEDYAIEIARDWNTTQDSKQGFVTRFAVDAAFLARYERRTVGAMRHAEYWIPAEELDEFNAHIVGEIETIARFTEADRLATATGN